MSVTEHCAASLREGDQYFRAATGGLKREAVFTPEILYNILGMAIEKYALGFLYHKGKMADNHTFVDLVDAMGKEDSFPEELGRELAALQRYQEICSLSAYSRICPDRAAILEMIETTRKLESFVKAACDQGGVSRSSDFHLA
jgi:hypothetical protein